MERYLPREEPRSYLYELLSDYPARGGKMLRSSLCIATARATGGRLEDAVASAVSIELMHNALLVHDDIEDDSDRAARNTDPACSARCAAGAQCRRCHGAA